MSNSVIKVEGLSKRYRLGLKEKQAKTLVGQIGNILKSPWTNLKHLRDLNKFGQEDESVFWALKDLNFEVKQGEVLGIIGKNGAGKSTLLKILSQITDPTSGKIEIHGRVASLLEVGTGFHPELSGRDNIYMNGTILGMTRREIDSKLDEIIDFSGVEKFIDTPVKFYSSGMKVRLGFSVAAHLEPEILIIDEVLSVGDFDFQAKCLGKMEEVSISQGRTVLFVSHNLQAVSSLCTKAMVLKNSKIYFHGNTDLALEKYLLGSSNNRISSNWELDKFNQEKEVQFVKAKASVRGNQPNLCLYLELETQSFISHPTCFFAINLSSLDGTHIFQSIPQEEPFINFSKDLLRFKVSTDLPPLNPGDYNLSIWIGPHYTHTIDYQIDILRITISESPISGRVYPFSKNNGFISPISKLILNG